MKNVLRVSLGVNKVVVGNPVLSLENTINLIDSTPPSDVLLLPKFTFTPPSCGGLFANDILYNTTEHIRETLKAKSAQRSGIIFAGIIIKDSGKHYSAMAGYHGGQEIALIPTTENPEFFVSGEAAYKIGSPETLIKIGDTKIKVHTGNLDSLVKSAAGADCDLLLVPTYEPMIAGKIREIRRTAKTLSKSLGIGIAIVNGGIGDTSFPQMYHGFTLLVENGKELIFADSHSEGFVKTADLDTDIIRSGRKNTNFEWDYLDEGCKIEPIKKTGKLLRKIELNPFLPSDSWEKEEYLAELFEYQVQSLVARMRNTGLYNLVLGVSGGVDSTAALMVSIAACDYLGLPRTNIFGITMPGLGTSSRTYNNAINMLNQLEITWRDISIKPSVELHFSDIGHSGEPDTTYENAQARERTQILFDISNMVGGLVVGSGDLSEEALGFSTFGGDHLAGYNVNCCMTKTMLRELLQYFIDNSSFPEIEELLADVLATPVSPELLPPDDSGEILQKTEDILGPYELHEFFLYYFVGYNMSPKKIYRYACQAFSGTLSNKFILEKLKLFFKKFCSNQFKRSCVPDGCSITPVNLLGVTYSIPSDMSAGFLLTELDDINQNFEQGD